MLKRLNTNKKQKLLREETRDFLTASQAGDLELISKFISKNFDVNSKNENGLTALHLASKEGHSEVIRELLKRGADVNSTTKRGNGALHMACVGGQLDAVTILLLENTADVNAQSENGFTPLYIAAQENHLDLVKFLLEHGANATLKTDDLFLPLDIALQQGNVQVVESLVEDDPSNKASLPALHVAARNNDIRLARFLLENGSDVNRTSASGFTALHIGARYGNFDICQLLIEKGADVNFKAKNGITALHVCSKEGRSALVDLLLTHGADPNSQTTEGLTAVHCAAVNGHDQALDSLVRNGALLGLKTKTGLTPLHMALQGNQLSCTRQLLQYNAPIDDFSEDMLTPLHVAAHCGNLRAAQILLEAGCDVNAKAKNGFSPLHVACKRNHKEMTKQLLQYKATVNQTSDSGILPVHVAAFMGHTDILTSMIQNGANLNAPTGGGMTPVYLAALANRSDAIELLLQKGADVDAGTEEQRTALHVASELGNTNDVVSLLQHGASPHLVTSDQLLPLDFAATAGHGDVVQLLCEHGSATEGKSLQKTPPSSAASALQEFSTVREAMRYIKDENDGLKTPATKQQQQQQQQPLSEFVRSSTSRSKTRDRDSRLSHTHSSLVLPGSPSVSFWSSFLTDARGGEMIGCRHSGVRVILPPSKIPNPIGIRCRLIRKEKLPFPPLLREGEGLACRALETAPAGSKFLGPVIFEVPHFASLRNEEREIVILRSDNGKSWTEHLSPSLDELEPVLKNSLLSDMRRETNSALMHIITVDLPHFFTLVSRIRMKQEEFSADEGSLSTTLTPKVKVTFPPESFRRKTKVGLQVQPVSQSTVSKVLDDESCVSPIVTIQPQRRKFRSPVSVTMPLNENEISAKNTRLLCSLSDGKAESVWEDISDLTPLAVARDLVSFTTSVSGKYWLLSSPKVDLRDVQKLYSASIPVPYFSRFVIFAKRLSASEGHLRIFCVTDDKVDKTLERQEQFIEVARSEDVEVLDGTAVYIHLEGNLLPSNPAPADDQLHLNFHAFRENRLPLAVLVVDPDKEASGHVTFTRDPGTRIPGPSDAISTLRATLPAFDDGKSSEKIPFTSVFQPDKPKVKDAEPELLKAELRLADIAELIGEKWKQVAERLGISRADVDLIQSDCDHPTDRALAVLQQWMDENGSRANGNSLEMALRDLGMDDIITSCMINVADVTDDEEKAAAKSYLDAGVDPLRTELGSARDLGSSDGETIRHSLSPDDAYEEIELRKAGLLLPSEGRKTSDEDNKSIEEMTFRERFPFMDRSLSTVSTNTLTTLPSDGGGDTETLNQSTDDISSSSDQTIVKAEVHEEETKLEDGSSVTRKVVTVRHFKRCEKASEDLLLTLVEMDEDITVLPPGVTLPLEDGVVLERDVDNSEELLDNGVLLVHKVTRTNVAKAPSGEKDAPSQETDRLPSENYFAVEDLSAASPSPSEILLSASGSSDPQQALGTRAIPAEEDVPVVEEELTEETSGQTFRSSPWTSPSKWNASDRSPAEGESQETTDEIEGNCDFLVNERPSTEVIACEVISQRDHEAKVDVNLEFDPNFKNTSQDPLTKYPEDEKPLGWKSPENVSSQSNRSLSTDLSAKEGQLESMAESSYRCLESGPRRESLLEDAVTGGRQTEPELFQCKYFESSSQHEFLSKEPTLMSGGRQNETEAPCKYVYLEAQDDAVLEDMESEHREGGKPTFIKLESGHFHEPSLPDSTSEFIKRECHSIAEFNRKYLESGSENLCENLSEEETEENSEDGRRRSVNDEAKHLKSIPQPHLKDFSQDLIPEERQPTTESVSEYLDSGPGHNVTIATATADGSDLAAESGSKRLEPGPTHAVPMEDTLSDCYQKQEATESEYEYPEPPETQLELLPEELSPGQRLERTKAFFEQSISGKTEAAEVNECKQRDVCPPEIVGEGIDCKILEIKENLPLSAFEEDDEFIGEKKPVEGTLVRYYELPPAQLRGYGSDENAYGGILQPDRLLFGRRTLEGEEKSDREDMFKHSSVILRRRVHKKTLLTAGCQEQTIVTEDTQVEQDNEAPKELSSAIQQIIEQFVHGKNSFVTCYNAC